MTIKFRVTRDVKDPADFESERGVLEVADNGTLTITLEDEAGNRTRRALFAKGAWLTALEVLE